MTRACVPKACDVPGDWNIKSICSTHSMVSGFDSWLDVEQKCGDFVRERRRVANVQKGLIYTSYFFVLELLDSMQERYGTQVQIPDTVYRQLMYDSLLLHHSMLGTMHVQKKTLQTMEQQLCFSAEAAVRRLALGEA